MSLSQAFEVQAKNCDELGSPFTARLCRLLAAHLQPGTALTDRLFSWPGDLTHTGANVPLRLTGALHALVLSGRDPSLGAVYPPAVADDATLWSAIAAALAHHQDFVQAFLDSPPQTNEVARSAALVAVGNWLSQRFGLPIILSELGASAGLNLNWDCYALHLGGTRFGPAGAAPELAPESRGGVPHVASPVVAGRRGVDLRPIDLTDPAQALRLQSYIWPDQTARMDRMRLAAALPPAPVDQGDAAGWLQERLATAHPGHLHLVYHTIAWTYFPAETQRTCRAALDDAGARARESAPLVHFAMEADGSAPGAALTLEIWPGMESWSLGRFDFHGRWLDWNPIRLS